MQNKTMHTQEKVFVLNMRGEPLMPCKASKARKLLKNKKADVVTRTPYTIQLRHGSSGYKQDITVGVDAGSKTIAICAATKKEELFVAEVKPRNDVVKNLSERRAFRKARRNRKTRYRIARFENRVRSKHKGWLAVSVEVKIQEHLTSILRVCKMLPVKKIIVETAEFDLQRLKAKEMGLAHPVGTDYQEGEMLDAYNVRQYVLHRDGYQCRCCKAVNTDKKQVKFHVHHLESRQTGGDAPDNLITLCEQCHKAYHKGLIQLPTDVRKLRSTRDAAFMGIMRKTFIERLRGQTTIPVVETCGYITKHIREEVLHLEKSHINDALAIALGKEAKNTQRAETTYLIKPVRHHNRMLHKATILKGGIRKSNQAEKTVFGFRLFDKVKYNGIECFVWGRRSTGSFLLKKLDGTKIKDGVSYKQITLLEKSKNYLIERRKAVSSPYLKVEVSNC